MASTVILSKALVDGKRPGDTFTRQGDAYRVVRVYRYESARQGAVDRIVTESQHGREVWF